MMSRFIRLFRKGADHIQTFGLKSFLKKVPKKVLIKCIEKITGKPYSLVPTVASSPSGVELSYQQVPRLRPLKPLQAFTTPPAGVRINLVTDSINAGSLYGGVGTAIIFSALLAKRLNCQLRVITGTQRAEAHNFFEVLKNNKIGYDRNVEFVFADIFSDSADVDISSDDRFITTSWWTTYACLESVAAGRVTYLLQEDERMFYPYGDDHLRCSSILSQPNLKFVVNTELLFNHFVSEGFDNIAQNGMWFEPSFSSYSVPSSPATNLSTHQSDKRRFFFYARPNNLRNLFYLGLSTLEAAVSQGVLSLDEWEICFVGKDLSGLKGLENIQPTFIEGLSWSEYVKFLGSVDVGLSLMYTPHPSYPPLDLAASGCISVTNRHGVKQDLSRYSRNVICKDPTVESLVQGIKEAVELANNQAVRTENYRSNKMLKDWEKSFEYVLSTMQ